MRAVRCGVLVLVLSLFIGGAALAQECGPDNPCPEDGAACTVQVCTDGVCGVFVQQGCFVADALPFPCLNEGDINSANQCQVCRNALNPTGWSPAADGLACESDGRECTNDICVEGVCTNQPRPSTTPCGPSVTMGPDNTTCDMAQFCTGTGPDCPGDAVKPEGTPCRDAGGPCGIAETCDGASKDCPTQDLVQPAETPCGELAGSCDVVDFCNGNETICPTSNVQPDGTACDLDGNPATADKCQDGVCEAAGHVNTLVVRVKFNGINGEPVMDAASVVAGMNALVTKASYGAESIVALYPPTLPTGTRVLEHDRTWYESEGRIPEVALTTEVLNTLLGENADILGDLTVDAHDNIRHVVILTNLEISDSATTGPFTFHVTPPSGPSRDIDLSASINSLSSNPTRYAHAIGHQMGMVDLYQYENTTVPEGSKPPTGWDLMADTMSAMTGSLPLMWSKMIAGWVDSSRVYWVPEADYSQAGSSWSQQFDVTLQANLQAGEKGAVVIGRSGVSAFADETEFYFIEARCRDGNDCEGLVPASGVLVYSASSSLPPGYMPVRVVDFVDTTPTVADAVLQNNGDSVLLAGAGLRVTLVGRMAGDAGYVVTVARTDETPLTPPYDLWMERGDPAWMSPDIWMDPQNSLSDSLACGQVFDPAYENPIGGQENRIWVRVHNTSDAAVQNVLVHFGLSSPYTAAGGFEPADEEPIIPEIPANSFCYASIVWEPEAQDDPHNCVQVELLDIPDDTNAENDWAQRNFWVVPAESGGGGYKSIEMPFMAKNHGETPLSLVFAAEGIPAGWDWKLEPDHALLQAGEALEGRLVVQPPATARNCTDYNFRVVSYKRAGDTMVVAGGTDIMAQLRNETGMAFDATWLRCSDADAMAKLKVPFMGRADAEYQAFLKETGRRGGECGVMVANGCTRPAQPNQRMTLRFSDPDGNPIFRDVTTDSSGCFQDAAYAIEGGKWNATARFQGADCAGPATGTIPIDIDLPRTGDTDGDGLADVDEPHGDLDRDGLPCFMDRDCDGDGLDDGREGKGDADRDGFKNVNDTDSDNDGVTDGKDSFPTHVCRNACSSCQKLGPLLWVLLVLALILVILASMIRRAHWLVFIALALLIVAHLIAWFCCLDAWLIPTLIGMILNALVVAGVYIRRRLVK